MCCWSWSAGLVFLSPSANASVRRCGDADGQPRHADAVWCPAPGQNCLMPSRRTAKGYADQVSSVCCPALGLASLRLPYVGAGSECGFAARVHGRPRDGDWLMAASLLALHCAVWYSTPPTVRENSGCRGWRCV